MWIFKISWKYTMKLGFSSKSRTYYIFEKTLVEKLKLIFPFLFPCCIFFSIWTFQGCYRKSLTTWQHTYTQVCMYLQDKNLAYPPPSRFSHPIVNHRTIIDQQFTTLEPKGQSFEIWISFFAIFVSIFSKEWRK